MNGQVRVLIEGINTTEGTGGAGFYFDYSSLEEVFLGTIGPVGRDAEPRRAEPVHRQVGRQPVQRRVLPRLVQQLAAGLEHSRRRTRCRRRSTTRRFASTATRSIATTTRHQRRRPDQEGQDLVVRHLPHAVQRDAQPNFQFDKTFDTKLWNAVGKGTYQVNQKHKIDRLLPVGPEDSAEPAAAGHLHLSSPEGPTNRQDSGSWVYKARVERHDQRQAVCRSALRRLRLLLPADHQRHRAVLLPRHRHAGDHRLAPEEPERSRSQAVEPARPPTSSTPPRAATRSRSAREMLKELQWFGVLQGVGGNIEHVYNNGVSNQVIFRIPTATQVGGLKDNDNGHLTTENALDQLSVFVNDTWSIGRLTVNGGVRWDRYNGWLPEQNQLAATVGPVSRRRPRRSRRRTSSRGTSSRRASAWSIDLTRRRQDRAEGQLRSLLAQPGRRRAERRQPEHRHQVGDLRGTTAGADCINGDRRWQPGEEDHAAVGDARGRDAARSEHQGAVLARGGGLVRAAADRHASASAPASSTRPKTT